MGGGGAQPPPGLLRAPAEPREREGGGRKVHEWGRHPPPPQDQGTRGTPPHTKPGRGRGHPAVGRGGCWGDPGDPHPPRGPTVAARPRCRARAADPPPPPPHLPVLKGPPPSALKGTAPLFPAWLAGCLPWDWGGGGGSAPTPRTILALSAPSLRIPLPTGQKVGHPPWVLHPPSPLFGGGDDTL